MVTKKETLAKAAIARARAAAEEVSRKHEEAARLKQDSLSLWEKFKRWVN